MPVHPLQLFTALDGLAALGFAGANVTMPHKAAVADLVDDPSDDARRLHAVNTIVCHGDRLRGENTDAPGFERFLRIDAGFDPSGRHALIFGAGGAARACALALARSGVASITVAARKTVHVTEVAEALEGFGVPVEAVAVRGGRRCQGRTWSSTRRRSARAERPCRSLRSTRDRSWSTSCTTPP